MAKAKAAKGGKSNARPIVIKKEEIIEGGHHGGAWKVAYADFVTAMMAFFLLMWLINATTTAQRIGLADYFSKANVLNRGASGEGKPFGGSDPFDSGALASNMGTIQVMPGKNQPMAIHPPLQHPQNRRPDSGSATQSPPNPRQPAQSIAPQKQPAAQQGPQQNPQAAAAAAARSAAQTARQQEAGAFQQAAQDMRKAIDAQKALSAYAGQISISSTPQGIKIQIIDSHDKPMFALGSADPAPATQVILSKIAPILGRLAHPISIAGYTDGRAYASGAQSNWQLSVERANAARAILTGNGLPEADLAQVAGYADRQLLMPKDPLADSNRRITITIAKTATPSFGPTQ